MRREDAVSEERSPGLCADCRWARVVRTPRSVFWLCERSRTDLRYPRYPRLPVTACEGHEPRDANEAAAGGPPPREEE